MAGFEPAPFIGLNLLIYNSRSATELRTAINRQNGLKRNVVVEAVKAWIASVVSAHRLIGWRLF